MPTSRTPHRRILILADREAHTINAPEARMLTDAAADNHVLIVVPAGPVVGERWTIDLAARQIQAEKRLAAWTALLAQHAREVDSEVGDANPRMAISDARHEFKPDAVITLERHATLATSRMSRVARLAARASTGPVSRSLPTAA